jgi:TRAP-type C4-dicarboxylate transport system permease small subunit
VSRSRRAGAPGIAKRVADFLADASVAVGGAALVAAGAIIVVDVVGRVFGAPLRGAQDLAQMALVLIVFGGMAFCDRIGGHVSVDLFETSFSVRANLWFAAFANGLGALIFSLIAFEIWESSKISQMLNLATNILKLPKAPFQYAVAAFCVITALGMLVRMADCIGRARGPLSAAGDSTGNAP